MSYEVGLGCRSLCIKLLDALGSSIDVEISLLGHG
jgi:hypothetical protein